MGRVSWCCLVVGLTAGACSSGSAQTSRLHIVHGRPAEAGEGFGQVLVGLGSHCTGVIIAVDAVLTASHCLAAVGEAVEFYSGAYRNGETTPVLSVSYQEGLQPASGGYRNGAGQFADLAVLRVAPLDMQRYRIARLPTESGAAEVGSEGWIAGRGRHDHGTATTNEMRVRSARVDRSWDEGRFALSDVATDSGDSGGPFLMHTGEAADWTVIGILHGLPQQGPLYSLFTDVGLQRQWLLNQLGGL